MAGMNYSGFVATENIDLGFDEVIFRDNMTHFTGIMTPSTPEQYVPGNTLYDLVKHIKISMLGVIVPVGIIGNILTLTVLLKSTMRKRKTGHYLLSLTLADTVLLLGELMLLLNSYNSKGTVLGFDFAMSVDIWCKIMTYSRYVGRIWSSWMICWPYMVLMDDMLAVYGPHG